MEAIVIIALAVLCCIVIAAHVIAFLAWTKERRDLLNRIIAKNGTEYIRISSPSKDKKETVRQRRKKAWRADPE